MFAKCRESAAGSCSRQDAADRDDAGRRHFLRRDYATKTSETLDARAAQATCRVGRSSIALNTV